MKIVRGVPSTPFCLLSLGCGSGSPRTRLFPVSVAACAILAAVTGANAASVKGARPAASASETAVVRVASGGETISTIRTARGVTTMVSLPEEAKEAICGDLFDPQSGQGGFVIQRSGKDIFLKPLRGAGQSNLFVKTERATYAFELTVVPVPHAMRIVYVDVAAPLKSVEAERERLSRERDQLNADRTALAKERTAMIAELERRRERLGESAEANARDLVEATIIDAFKAEDSVVRLARKTGRSGSLEVEFGDALLVVGGRAYLRCTLKNRTRQSLVIASALLDSGAKADLHLTISAGGSAMGLLVFDGPFSRTSRVRFVDLDENILLSAKPW